jgi:zinc transport system substrate-binding protein
MVVSTLTGTATAHPKVVATIKPVHALLLQIMAGVAEPTLLVRGSSSPHTYALTPSDVMALSHADVVVRVSPAIEPFTQKFAGTLSSHVEVVTLIDTPGLKLFATRRGPIFNRAGTLYHAHQVRPNSIEFSSRSQPDRTSCSTMPCNTLSDGSGSMLSVR